MGISLPVLSCASVELVLFSLTVQRWLSFHCDLFLVTDGLCKRKAINSMLNIENFFVISYRSNVIGKKIRTPQLLTEPN